MFNQWEPGKLSRQLRHGSGASLKRRRGIIGLNLLAAGSMGLITLYQMGILKHLPEPDLPGFDGDRVDASEEAYSMLSMPDAPLGFASYGATMVLAAMGGVDRARKTPWIPIALAAKVGADAVMAAQLTRDQWTKHRAFCLWCLVAAGATFAAVPLAMGEVREALGHLNDRDETSSPAG